MIEWDHDAGSYVRLIIQRIMFLPTYKPRHWKWSYLRSRVESGHRYYMRCVYKCILKLSYYRVFSITPGSGPSILHIRPWLRRIEDL
ncbi:uncharacterized protein Bfra_000534 [Botrytis fragariae]|uniref:Uncharacterized protein n=1 Tax=Botrytis fragariae TaxID=1964551 RepID=A0A8H6EN88_9HELO|nr:uncharacterized protein Bfra_000534 [Botrytis fragariae]KAF5878369.1 hypothetical protein Bfra_000534 [Botrytis fragariae]